MQLLHQACASQSASTCYCRQSQPSGWCLRQFRQYPYQCNSCRCANRVPARNAAAVPVQHICTHAFGLQQCLPLQALHGKGVVQLDGQMVERLHVEMAKRTIAIADAIAVLKVS